MDVAGTFRTLSQPISRLSFQGWRAYVFATGMIALAVLTRWLLPEDLGLRVPFPTFFLAVFLSAWVGGWRAGLLASCLTVVCGFTIFPITRPPLDWRDAVALGFVFSVCVVGAYACSRLRGSMDVIEKDRLWCRRILERIGDAVLVVDEAERLRYFNQHAAGLWGLQDSDIGRKVDAVAGFWGENHGGRFEDLAALIRDQDGDGELPPGLEVRTDGQAIPVVGTISRFQDPEYGAAAIVAVQSIHALRQANLQVESTERRMRALFDSDIVGLFSINGRGRIISINRAMLRLLDYPLDGQSGPHELQDIADEDLLAQLGIGGTENAIAFGPFDCALLDRSNNPVWVALGVVPITLRERIVFATDIRSRRLAESALALKQTELRLILNAVPARIAYMDADGVFQWANRNFTEWFGVHGDIKGRSLDTVMPPDVVATLYQPLQVARRGFVGQVEWLENHADYGLRWTTTTFSPDLDDRGRVRGVISLCMDSTERHENEEALRRSDAEHRTLAENVPHMVWMSDPQGSLQYCNARWHEYTGREALGHWTGPMHPNDRPSADAAFGQAMVSRTGLNIEARYRRADDGAFRWHLVRALPLLDPLGQVLRWYGTCTDIEDQKIAQETLREAHSRTTHFLATLSHELRNPLAALMASAEVLDHAQSDAERLSETGKAIQRQAWHLKRLTDDLLDISRITLGRIQMANTVIDLREICQDVCADFSEKAERFEVRLECRVPPEHILVTGDPSRIRQCVDNLVSNAIKASSGGMGVFVETRVGERFAEIIVRDEGVGIEEDALSTIFLPFSQGDEWRNQGLGLGLSIVSKLVELHGGSVWAESRGRNQGSTFGIRLPLADSKPPARPAPVEMPPEALVGRVLIVDDETDNAVALQYLLALDGHDVFVAEDGVAALALAESVQPDVVICDLGLPPPLHGLEVARHLRQARGDGIHLCAYSGYGAREDVQRSLASGFDAHLTKPGTPRSIADEVARGLARVKRSRESKSPAPQ